MKFKGYSSPITVMEQTPALDVVAIGLEDGTIDILNLKVERIAVEEGPALGAAMLAAVGCGVFSSVEEAAQAIVQVVDVIEPEPELVEKYQDRYQTFRQLYPALKEIYRQL